MFRYHSGVLDMPLFRYRCGTCQGPQFKSAARPGGQDTNARIAMAAVCWRALIACGQEVTQLHLAAVEARPVQRAVCFCFVKVADKVCKHASS